MIEKVNNQSHELGSFLCCGVLCAGRNHLAWQAAAFQQGTEHFKSHKHEKMYKQTNGQQLFCIQKKINATILTFVSFCHFIAK